ncbi:NAD(P)-dependent oxidoreductase [Ideonella sp. A 288]|uniref:NAD(P)-dependent oxidoreductase n=1 Tax=Ideonella sp. A 288 TaxID=1962181 RepID=UPI0018FEF038|nr:NAD(P)-dependent oxidoreductase [Ideonella sp. A 288]
MSADPQPRLLVTQPIDGSVAARLSAVGTLDLHPGPEPVPPAELARRLAGCQAMMGFMPDRVDAALLAQAPGLRIVACALKGHDGYDAAACTSAGVWLTTVPDLLSAPTAELALGLAIGLARHLRRGDALVRSGVFDGWRPVLYGRGLDGATVVVVGLGSVGRALVRRLQGFGCRVIGVDAGDVPTPTGVSRQLLDEALAVADTVFLALPLTAHTRHLVDADRLGRTRPGALWVNVGRGSVVDELAMASALETGQAGGYAADVFAFEDLSLPDRPAEILPRLRTHPHTLFSPHLGSAVADVRRAIEHRAADNILAVLRGGVPPDAVNRLA